MGPLCHSEATEPTNAPDRADGDHTVVWAHAHLRQLWTSRKALRTRQAPPRGLGQLDGLAWVAGSTPCVHSTRCHWPGPVPMVKGRGTKAEVGTSQLTANLPRPRPVTQPNSESKDEAGLGADSPRDGKICGVSKSQGPCLGPHAAPSLGFLGELLTRLPSDPGARLLANSSNVVLDAF